MDKIPNRTAVSAVKASEQTPLDYRSDNLNESL